MRRVIKCDRDENSVLERALAGEELSEELIHDLIVNFEVEDFTIDIGNRWLDGKTSIILLTKRENGIEEPHYFAVDWNAGKTEMQMNEYWSQTITEVTLIKKVIEVKDWVTIDTKESIIYN